MGQDWVSGCPRVGKNDLTSLGLQGEKMTRHDDYRAGHCLAGGLSTLCSKANARSRIVRHGVQPDPTRYV